MAKDDTAKRLERMAKLLEKGRELTAQLHDVQEEMRKICAGESAMGDDLKVCEKVFSDEWQRHYGTPYLFAYMKDRPHWKRLLKGAKRDDVIGRVMAYFHADDDYTRRARHPFGLFVSRFNQLAPVQTEPELTLDSAPVVADCKHTPPCKSDQEHTRRKLDDLRPPKAAAR